MVSAAIDRLSVRLRRNPINRALLRRPLAHLPGTLGGKWWADRSRLTASRRGRAAARVVSETNKICWEPPQEGHGFLGNQ